MQPTKSFDTKIKPYTLLNLTVVFFMKMTKKSLNVVSAKSLPFFIELKKVNKTNSVACYNFVLFVSAKELLATFWSR